MTRSTRRKRTDSSNNNHCDKRRDRRQTKSIDYNENVVTHFDDVSSSPVLPITCRTEHEAVEQTGEGTTRRLFQFEVADERRSLQPLRSSLGPLFLRGVIQPKEGEATKKTGRYVEAFGPLLMWSVVYTTDKPTVQVRTNEHVYLCGKPSARYHPIFTHLWDQLLLSHQLYLQLGPQGETDASYDTVIQRLQRSKVKHGYRTWREAISANATFILEQLPQMTMQQSNASIRFEESAFALALQQEFAECGTMSALGGIHIDDMSGEPVGMSADEVLARQLQAKEEAKFMLPDTKSAVDTSAGYMCFGLRENHVSIPGYLSVFEEDIADAYPLLTMYEKFEEETDEFLTADEDIGLVDPEHLPQRILTDFAIYDAEGLLKPLELLPCWNGAPPAVELYASGIIEEENDDQGELLFLPGAAGSSSAAVGSSTAVGGSSDVHGGVLCESTSMRMYSSQIQEYVVECDVDAVRISIRTEVSWYRLERPSMTYAPWFDVTAKCARLAIKIISLLLKEARACKLSFADITSLLSKEPKTSEIFISSNVADVKGVLIRHGAFILNQLLQYPDPRIQQCGFASNLKDQLLTRQHCKSVLLPKKIKHHRQQRPSNTSIINKNPMKDRAASVRTKALPAAATMLVQSIWKNYFTVHGLDKEHIKAEDVIPEEETGDRDLTECETEVGGDTTKSFSVTDACEGLNGMTSDGYMYVQSPISHRAPYSIYSSAQDSEGVVECGDVVMVMESAQMYGCKESQIGNQLEGMMYPKDALGMIQCFLEKEKTGEMFVQLRSVVKGKETVLGDAACNHEFFLKDKWTVINLDKISRPVKNIKFVTVDDSGNQERDKQNKETERRPFMIKLVYCPEEGMFKSIQDLQLGAFKVEKEVNKKQMVMKEGSFMMNGCDYHVGDAVFFDPQILEEDADIPIPDNLPSYVGGREHKGSIRKMRPYGIGSIISVKTFRGSKVNVGRSTYCSG